MKKIFIIVVISFLFPVSFLFAADNQNDSEKSIKPNKLLKLLQPNQPANRFSTSSPTPTATPTPTANKSLPVTCRGVCVTSTQSCPTGTIRQGNTGCPAIETCSKSGIFRTKKQCTYISRICCIPAQTPTPSASPTITPTPTVKPTVTPNVNPTPTIKPTITPTPTPTSGVCSFACRPAKLEGSWKKSWITKCNSNEIAIQSFCPIVTQKYSCGTFGMRTCTAQVSSICCKPK